MQISFIGCGKAASSLGKYFLEKGHCIKYVYDIINRTNGNGGKYGNSS